VSGVQPHAPGSGPPPHVVPDGHPPQSMMPALVVTPPQRSAAQDGPESVPLPPLPDTPESGDPPSRVVPPDPPDTAPPFPESLVVPPDPPDVVPPVAAPPVPDVVPPVPAPPVAAPPVLVAPEPPVDAPPTPAPPVAVPPVAPILDPPAPLLPPEPPAPASDAPPPPPSLEQLAAVTPSMTKTRRVIADPGSLIFSKSAQRRGRVKRRACGESQRVNAASDSSRSARTAREASDLAGCCAVSPCRGRAPAQTRALGERRRFGILQCIQVSRTGRETRRMRGAPLPPRACRAAKRRTELVQEGYRGRVAPVHSRSRFRFTQRDA